MTRSAIRRLSNKPAPGTSPNMSLDSGPPLLFDPKRRALARDRAHARFTDHDFLYRFMLDGLLERLGDVKRSFGPSGGSQSVTKVLRSKLSPSGRTQ